MPKTIVIPMPFKDVVRFIPDARDASRDFLVSRDDAWSAFKAGHISFDQTNGGFCPRPGYRYDMKRFKVL